MPAAVAMPIDPRPMPPVPVRQFSVAEYHRLAELGVLTPEDRVELLDGWIVPKVTQHPPHASALVVLNKKLLRLLDEAWSIRTQLPITLATSEPEPDVVVAVGPDERYFDSHPVAKDVALVVEIADASLSQDRGLKLQLYARARLAVYWIVNLVHRQVEIYTAPRAGRSPTYRNRGDYGPDDRVPVILQGREVARFAAREFLP